ncbi:hypothetical protein [Bacillus sp. Marseille-P3800]|uniref:hypothetical protein n=1 Tax=Bacillus sp. Marseille-P3800 TaxID=2014782 RepID=UPI000C07A546|nr:hypothetical protein [Bacillus sp. Marseille-P3800]
MSILTLMKKQSDSINKLFKKLDKVQARIEEIQNKSKDFLPGTKKHDQLLKEELQLRLQFKSQRKEIVDTYEKANNEIDELLSSYRRGGGAHDKEC